MYTDQTQITGYLQRPLTENEATIVTGVIKAVSDWINEYTGDNFEPSAPGTARSFVGGERFLIIDPIIDIDSVSWLAPNGDVQNTYDSTDYVAYPLNAVSKTQLELIRGASGIEFGDISSDGNGYGYLRWPKYGRIQVTGKWGEVDGIPDDIRLAATILAVKWLRDTSNVRIEMIEGYRVEFFDPSMQDANVMRILDSRKRIRL